jgi:agmatinase
MTIAGFQRTDRFLGFDADFTQARWVLGGVPMDFTASFQAGSRFGPPRIREASYGLETYSPLQDADLTERALYDAGDLELPIGNVSKSLALIEDAAADLLARGKRLLALGGEHLITLPLITAALRAWPDLLVVHWDAHADLRDTYLEERFSHATVLRRVAELVGDGRVYQFGIRSGTAEELAWGRAHTHLFPDDVLQPLLPMLDAWAGRPIYLTIDVDVFDPAFMPGTGTPEPGGITPREGFMALSALRGQHIVGADIVETMPAADPSLRSALLAAKLVRETALLVTGEHSHG